MEKKKKKGKAANVPLFSVPEPGLPDVWNCPWSCSPSSPSLLTSFWGILKSLSWKSTTYWRWLEKALLGGCTRVEENTVLRWWSRRDISWVGFHTLNPSGVWDQSSDLYSYDYVFLYDSFIFMEYELWNWLTWVQVIAPPLSSLRTIDKLLNLSMSQFSHL